MNFPKCVYILKIIIPKIFILCKWCSLADAGILLFVCLLRLLLLFLMFFFCVCVCSQFLLFASQRMISSFNNYFSFTFSLRLHLQTKAFMIDQIKVLIHSIQCSICSTVIRIRYEQLSAVFIPGQPVRDTLVFLRWKTAK